MSKSNSSILTNHHFAVFLIISFSEEEFNIFNTKGSESNYLTIDNNYKEEEEKFRIAVALSRYVTWIDSEELLMSLPFLDLLISHGQGFFVFATCFWLVVMMMHKIVWQVLLVHPLIWIVMRILIVYPTI